MPSITTASSAPAGTSPVIRSQAQSNLAPHAAPSRSGRKAARSISANGIGSSERSISARSGATTV